MTDERNKDLVRRHFEQIWNHRNLSACEELMAKDFVEHAAAPFAGSPPGAVDGPQAMRGTVEWLVSQFPDIHMTIEALVADGDIVVARVTSEGTNTGKLNGFLVTRAATPRTTIPGTWRALLFGGKQASRSAPARLSLGTSAGRVVDEPRTPLRQGRSERGVAT